MTTPRTDGQASEKDVGIPTTDLDVVDSFANGNAGSPIVLVGNRTQNSCSRRNNVLTTCGSPAARLPIRHVQISWVRIMWTNLTIFGQSKRGVSSSCGSASSLLPYSLRSSNKICVLPIFPPKTRRIDSYNVENNLKTGSHLQSKVNLLSRDCFADSPSTISSQSLGGCADPDADVDYHQSEQTSLAQAIAAVTLNSPLITSSKTSSSKSTVAINPTLGLTTGSCVFTIYLCRGRDTNSSPGDETSESTDIEDDQQPGNIAFAGFSEK
uniref:Uncharacterized protein n=1 Tax=Glossina austeni TaxID=7395 RepID=A0A1A9V9Q1_GLOAU